MSAISHGSDLTIDERARWLTVRMSLLIFLAFTILGAWVPVFSRYLSQLHFSPRAIAWASSANAIGAILAPLFWGQVADRWLASERCISLCASVSGLLLLLLGSLRDEVAVIFVAVVLWFFLIPVLTLTGAYIFRMIDHPESQFGKIRVWGTIGWMSASWGLALWLASQAADLDADDGDNDLSLSMTLAAWSAFVAAIYALTLPHAPPGKASEHANRSWLRKLADAPLSAMVLFRIRSFAVYCACMFGLYLTLPFTVQLNPLLLRGLGVADRWLPAFLTAAQTTEVASLLLLPFLLTRFGMKPTMMFGSIAWAVGLSALAIGSSIWLVLAAFLTHGLFICCFVIAGQVYVNRQASANVRASAQGILVLVNGLGLFFGHLLVGWLRIASNDSHALAYGVAGGIAATVFGLFAAGFTPKADPVPLTEGSLVQIPKIP